MKLVLLVAFAALFGLAVAELAPTAAAEDTICVAGVEVYSGSNPYATIGNHNILC